MMPLYIKCADSRCENNVTKIGDYCEQCKQRMERTKQEYERLTQKDSRNKKRRKGWKK